MSKHFILNRTFTVKKYAAPWERVSLQFIHAGFILRLNEVCPPQTSTGEQLPVFVPQKVIVICFVHLVQIRMRLSCAENSFLSYDILNSLSHWHWPFFEKASSLGEIEQQLHRELVQQDKAFYRQEFLKKIQAVFRFNFKLKKLGRLERHE